MYDYKEEAKEIKEELIRHRRYLHENPEIGLHLPNTKAYVIEQLKRYGYEPEEYGDSGIVALAGGKRPGKGFLMRADMDALPIQEETGAPYASKKDGCMHACGHDNHTAMLLGAAWLLKRHEEEIPGTVKLLFQPGEEILDGAKEMVEAGVLENPHVDAAMMIHVVAGTPVKEGTMGVFGPGASYSSSDWFRIDIQGKGGHGAMPNYTHNPLGAMCAIHQGIHEIMAEHRAPSDNCVMTVGEMHGGDTGNIIADSAFMRGTIRTFDEKVRTKLKEDLCTMTEYTAKAKGVTAKVTFGSNCPAVMVDKQVHASFLKSMQELLGEENTYDMRTVWGGAFSKASSSEDFSYIAEKVPSAVGWFFIGDSRNGYRYIGHHPKADFNDEYLYLGAAAYVKAGLDWLHGQEQA